MFCPFSSSQMRLHTNFSFGITLLYRCTFVRSGLVAAATKKIRVLETELSRAAAERDLLRKVALSAEARQHSEEDRAAELEWKSEVNLPS